MNKLAFSLLAALIGLSFSTQDASAQGMKIGIIDMNRVFAEYYKTKDAEKDVNDQKALAKKELDERNARYRELIDKYQALAKQIQDPAITEELRGQKQAQAKEVANEARISSEKRKSSPIVASACC